MDIEVHSFELLDASGEARVGPLELRLEAGSRWAMLGPTGAGKSLFLKSLVGLKPAGWKIQGRLSLGGAAWPESAAPRVLLMPQEPMDALNPWMSLREHLALLPRAWRIPGGIPRAEALAVRLGLRDEDGLWGRLPRALSHGQRQRLVLAMLLSLQPAWLLLDEPTAALDAENAAIFGDLLESLQAELGLGWIWVTHRPELALRHSDWVIAICGGRAVQVGPTSEVGAEAGAFRDFLEAAAWPE